MSTSKVECFYYIISLFYIYTFIISLLSNTVAGFLLSFVFLLRHLSESKAWTIYSNKLVWFHSYNYYLSKFNIEVAIVNPRHITKEKMGSSRSFYLQNLHFKGLSAKNWVTCFLLFTVFSATSSKHSQSQIMRLFYWF